jgi:hypothetical protein
MTWVLRKPQTESTEVDFSLILDQDKSNPLRGAAAKSFEMVSEDRRVRYHQRNTAEGNSISYDLPYAVLHDRSGPLLGVNLSYPAFAWVFPLVLLTPTNRTTHNVVVTSAQILVKKVKPVERPLLVFMDESPNNRLLVFNEGWGRVIDPVYRFTLLPGEDESPRPNEFEHTMRRPSFDLKDEILLKDFVPPSSPLASQDELRVVGEIDYRGEEGRGRLAFDTRILMSIPFGTPIPSAGEATVVLDPGLPPGESRPVDFREQLAPGETVHYDVRVGSKSTASYELEISLISHGRTLILKPLSLDVFVPRSCADRIKAGLRP